MNICTDAPNGQTRMTVSQPGGTVPRYPLPAVQPFPTSHECTAQTDVMQRHVHARHHLYLGLPLSLRHHRRQLAAQRPQLPARGFKQHSQPQSLSHCAV